MSLLSRRRLTYQICGRSAPRPHPERRRKNTSKAFANSTSESSGRVFSAFSAVVLSQNGIVVLRKVYACPILSLRCFPNIANVGLLVHRSFPVSEFSKVDTVFPFNFLLDDKQGCRSS